jgi:hypothetical protein
MAYERCCPEGHTTYRERKRTDALANADGPLYCLSCDADFHFLWVAPRSETEPWKGETV